MVRFVKCGAGADAIHVMNKVNRYVETEGSAEGKMVCFLPDITEEMELLRVQIEGKSHVYSYPTIVAEKKVVFWIKKVIRKLTWWMMEHSIQQQNEYNGLLIQYIDLMKEKQMILEEVIEEICVLKKDGEEK